MLLRGGECLGTFQTLVNPGASRSRRSSPCSPASPTRCWCRPRRSRPCCPRCSSSGATPWSSATTSASTSASSGPPASARTGSLPDVPRVDTVALARRLFGDEVRNHRLGTLAEQLRLDHQPSHRALDDALATGDLLHVLLERAGPPRRARPRRPARPAQDRPAPPGGQAQADQPPPPPARRLRLPGPRRPTALRRQGHQPAHPGPQLLLQRPAPEGGPAPAGDRPHRPHRLRRARWRPRCSRSASSPSGGPASTGSAPGPAAYTYLKLTCNEAFPRLSVVRTTKDDGAFYLGPLPSSRFAKRVAEAIETSVPLRRCTGRPTGARGRRRAPRPSSAWPPARARARSRPRSTTAFVQRDAARPHPRARAAAGPAAGAHGRPGPGPALRGGGRRAGAGRRPQRRPRAPAPPRAPAVGRSGADRARRRRRGRAGQRPPRPLLGRPPAPARPGPGHRRRRPPSWPPTRSTSCCACPAGWTSGPAASASPTATAGWPRRTPACPASRPADARRAAVA